MKTDFTRLRGSLGDGRTAWLSATQTIIAGLTADAMIVPWVIKGPMDGSVFAAYVEKVPELAPGSVVILDNLVIHRNAAAKAM